jgi:hypothetical protein
MHNLALLHYEAPDYSEIEKARTAAQNALDLCKGPQWKSFREYPEDLLARIETLLGREDVYQGITLDVDDTLTWDGS